MTPGFGPGDSGFKSLALSYIGVWCSLVARWLWEPEVARSSRAIPTGAMMRFGITKNVEVTLGQSSPIHPNYDTNSMAIFAEPVAIPAELIKVR